MFWRLICQLPHWQILSPICVFSSVLFIISCAVQRLLSLMRPHLLTFDFRFIILKGGSKKIHCCDLWQSVVPVFSSKSFIMSVLMFGSLIHFEFIFVDGVRESSDFILIPVAVQFSQHCF